MTEKLAHDPGRGLSLTLSEPAARRLMLLPDRARSMGIRIMAGKGSGKSRLMGRGICWPDFVRGVPTVVIDPNGPTIDNFLDKLVRLPREYQRLLGRRIRYVDMAGTATHVVPFPLYYRLPGDRLYDVAQRYLEVIRKLDPSLQSASILGWNAIHEIGTRAGMVLAALGCQVTEAEHLLRRPEQWQRRLRVLSEADREARPAAEHFLGEYVDLPPRERQRVTSSLLSKLAPFSLDEAARAMFGAATPGIDWQAVVNDGQAVLLDFRHVPPQDVRLKLLWAFNYLMSFIRWRGAGRHTPISVVVDELTYLTNLESGGGSELLSRELNELINVIARNYGVWLTLCHQENYQLSESVQKTLMTMGTQIIGVTTDQDAALMLSKQFSRYDPRLVKKQVPVWGSSMGQHYHIDYQDFEFSPIEQEILGSYQFRDLQTFQFLVAQSDREGSVATRLRPGSIAGLDRGIYVAEDVVAQAREYLMTRDAQNIEDTLADIDERMSDVLLRNEQRPRMKDDDNIGGVPVEESDEDQDDDDFWQR